MLHNFPAFPIVPKRLSDRLFAHAFPARYDLPITGEGEGMADNEVAELERQARAGKWLGSTAVATLLDIDRKTVHNWMTADPPIIRSQRFGIRNRRCNPADVLRLLDERRGTQSSA